MLVKEILDKETSRRAIKEGIDSITSVVASTLGPAGSPILLQRLGQKLNGDPQTPYITKDGVSVAREAGAPEEAVDTVIQTVKEICNQTNKVAGDGTTTAIVLGRAILNEALKLLDQKPKWWQLGKSRKPINPQSLRREIEIAAKKVDTLLQEMAKPCISLDLVRDVATISANGDREIGQIIRDAFEAVGSEGVITVDEGGSKENTLEIVNGFQFRRGAEGQERFFNNETNTKFEAEDAHIIIYDGKLQEPRQVLTALEMIHAQNNGKMPAVVFIANEFGTTVLQALLMLRAEQGLSVCAVKGPHTTTVRAVMYDDIATFLGGAKLGNGGRNLNNIEYDDIGVADRIVIDKYTTTIFGGQGLEEAVLNRVEKLKIQRSEETSPYDTAILSDRIAALSEGIAKIGVGGSTDLEIKEKYHRIEDAVNASRAAIEQGIIPGGGVTLYRISEKLNDPNNLGERILQKALKAPFRQIMENLGEDVETAQSRVNSFLKDEDTTYNGFTGQIVSALEAGIVDPVKVTRTALDRAVSVAATLCTCGGIIVYKKKREN